MHCWLRGMCFRDRSPWIVAILNGARDNLNRRGVGWERNWCYCLGIHIVNSRRWRFWLGFDAHHQVAYCEEKFECFCLVLLAVFFEVWRDLRWWLVWRRWFVFGFDVLLQVHLRTSDGFISPFDDISVSHLIAICRVDSSFHSPWAVKVN